MISDLKQHTIYACKKLFEDKFLFLSTALQEATEAGNSETKSTVGDKHETSKAMMQLEQEKLGKQLIDLETQKNEFDKLHFTPHTNSIKTGSLVKTNLGYFFIASALGKLIVKGTPVYIISNKSPLALVLLDLKPHAKIIFNGTEYLILSIE